MWLNMRKIVDKNAYNPEALFLNVSAEELRKVNTDPDDRLRLFEGGYIASLEVFAMRIWKHLHWWSLP